MIFGEFLQSQPGAVEKEMPVAEANDIVQQQLRHTRFSTTKRYLFNRKLKFEYENPGATDAKDK